MQGRVWNSIVCSMPQERKEGFAQDNMAAFDMICIFLGKINRKVFVHWNKGNLFTITMCYIPTLLKIRFVCHINKIIFRCKVKQIKSVLKWPKWFRYVNCEPGTIYDPKSFICQGKYRHGLIQHIFISLYIIIYLLKGRNSSITTLYHSFSILFIAYQSKKYLTRK